MSSDPPGKDTMLRNNKNNDPGSKQDAAIMNWDAFYKAMMEPDNIVHVPATVTDVGNDYYLTKMAMLSGMSLKDYSVRRCPTYANQMVVECRRTPIHDASFTTDALINNNWIWSEIDRTTGREMDVNVRIDRTHMIVSHHTEFYRNTRGDVLAQMRAGQRLDRMRIPYPADISHRLYPLHLPLKTFHGMFGIRSYPGHKFICWVNRLVKAEHELVSYARGYDDDGPYPRQDYGMDGGMGGGSMSGGSVGGGSMGGGSVGGGGMCGGSYHDQPHFNYTNK